MMRSLGHILARAHGSMTATPQDPFRTGDPTPDGVVGALLI